jgi:hypothetical protein
MPAKTDPRVDAYIDGAAPFARPVLRHLRALVHAGAPDAVETLKWGFPHFLLGDRILCSMAAFKAHCSFGFWHRGMERVLEADGLGGAAGMGSLGKIASLDGLPGDRAMRRYLKAAAGLIASDEPARPKPAGKTRPEPRVPEDLAVMLARNPKASAVFAGFSPSHRREYVEWIAEAKRPETRAKRLATTLEWLEAGKSRNWKYAGC